MGVPRAEAEAVDPAVSEGAGLRRAIAEVVALLLLLAKRSLAGVWRALVLAVRVAVETVLREARVLRTGTEMLPVPLPLALALDAAAGDGPLVPLDVGVAAATAGVVDLAVRAAVDASTLLLLLAAEEDGLASLFCRS